MIGGRSQRVLRSTLPAAVAVLVTAAAELLLPASAFAHASLIEREDLPLPEELFIYGALVVVVVSFVGLLLGWQRPHFENAPSRPAATWLSAALLNPAVGTACGLIGVALTALVVYAGLEGTAAPDRNFAVTFVTVTFGLGMIVVSVFLGDVFRAFNPWRAVGRFVSAAFTRLAGQRAPTPLAYPEWLGRWPAVVGLVGFLFLELVWGQTGFGLVGLEPRAVAIATLVYSAFTFTAMALFGVERWTDRGETFSQYFGMFASLSPLAVEDGALRLRRPLSAATKWVGTTAGSLALVLVSIGGTTFDGAQEGVLKSAIRSLFQRLQDGGLDPVAALRIANSVYLVLSLLVVAAIFWAGIQGMRIVERDRSARQLGRDFAHAFIPIALAYLVAHYFSYVVYLEQAQFSFLLSNPLGAPGTDIFGTADSGIDYGVVGGGLIQWVQFFSIVIGHVIALALGHDRALAIWGNTRDAAWSQLWMLVMMMFFSVLGLYLLSQANA